MIKNKQRLLACLLLFLLSCCLPPCSSAKATLSGLPQTSEDIKYKDAWTFHLSPYIWMAALSGHVNVQGNRVTFSNSLGDLRRDLDFSLGAHFEASKGPWSLVLDPDYVKITQNPPFGGINTQTTYETTITDIGAYYSLYSLRIPKEDYTRLSFELLGAGRIGTFHTMIDFFDANNTTLSDTSSVVVPVIGARFKYNFNSKFHTWINGDFGGFQVSHVSSTWSGMIGLSYNFTPFFDLSLAYKALAVNYSINAVTINTLLQGPVLGCGFSW